MVPMTTGTLSDAVPPRTDTVSAAGAGTGRSDWIEVVRRQVAGVRFGAVQIVVHDGRVVQVERTERVRLEPSSAV